MEGNIEEQVRSPNEKSFVFEYGDRKHPLTVTSDIRY